LFSLGHACFMLIGGYTYAIFTIPAAVKKSVYMYYDHVVNFSIPEVLGNTMGGLGEYLKELGADLGGSLGAFLGGLGAYLGGLGIFLGVLIAIILAGFVTAGVAYLVGLPALRLKGNYLAIATLGFAEIIRAVFMWGKLGPVTNGSNPLRSYVRQNFFKVEIGDMTFGLQTFFFVAFSAICIIIMVLLVNSSYGRAFKAIREDEIAAEAMGINLYKHKQLSFCISSFFTGIGGALLAIFMSSVAAINFDSVMTYEILLIVVMGGMGSVSGSIIGAVLFVFSSEWLLRGLDSGTFLGVSLPLFRSGFRLVVFSVFLMIVVLFFHRGIMGDKELPYKIREWKGKISALFSRKPKTGGESIG